MPLPPLQTRFSSNDVGSLWGTFLEVAQFLNGYDAGYTAALIKPYIPEANPAVCLSRFREWSANKRGPRKVVSGKSLSSRHFLTTNGLSRPFCYLTILSFKNREKASFPIIYSNRLNGQRELHGD